MARRLHGIINPVLAAEAVAMKERAAEGVYMNRNLPDFERRYLPDLKMGTTKGEKDYGEFLPLGRLDSLASWRSSTMEARRVNHPQLALLNRIEETVLVHGMPVPGDVASSAKANGWDLEAFEAWASSKQGRADRLPSLGSMSMIVMGEDLNLNSRWFKLPFIATLFGVSMAVLILLLILLNGQDAYTITNRTMVYALIIAPPGAILRWKLSELNGTVTVGGWQWFPLGTFSANFIGSIISIVAIAGEYTMDPIYDVTNFWGVGTVRAIKVGFVGSLTTVSTFVSEIFGFMQTSDHAYPYIFTTLMSCCAAASFFYGGLMVFRQE